jgi:trehalose 6-phosphate phosphatase
MNGTGTLLADDAWASLLSQWWTGGGQRLLALDFDGTLSPIAECPDAAVLPERERAALIRLAGRPGCHVLVISGRTLENVKRKTSIPGIHYAGSHGMEIEWAGELLPAHGGGVDEQTIRELTVRLETVFAGQQGIVLEPKKCSICVHYRLVPDAARASAQVRHRIISLLGEFPQFIIQGGKMVWELRPKDGWRKGDAILMLARHAGIPEAGILVMGDDLTDEYAFQALPGAFTVKVGEGGTVARWRLADRSEVAGFLEAAAAVMENGVDVSSSA